MTIRVSDPRTAPTFQRRRCRCWSDAQLRKNVRHATEVIQAQARHGGGARCRTGRSCGRPAARSRRTPCAIWISICCSSRNCTAAGGHVHWASDAEEAQPDHRRAGEAVRRQRGHQDQDDDVGGDRAERGAGGARHSRARDRSGGADHSAGHDKPSHIVVPALHKNRSQVREIFRERMNLPESGRHAGGAGGGGAALSAGEVSASAGRRQRREFSDRGDGRASASWSPRAMGVCA